MLNAIVATAVMGAEPSTVVPVQDEPLHHVVYSDNRLRVFDVDLPPHAVTLYHIHANDMVGVTLIPGPMRGERPGKAPKDEPADKPQEVWFDPHPQTDIHRVTNLGDSHIRMIAIELLTSSASRKMGVKREKAAGEVQLENDRVRAVRFSLRPGQTLPVHTNGSYVLVPLGPGRLANVCGTTEVRSVKIAGFLCAGSEGDHKISNVGNTPIDLIEFELST
jgi:quercetin dioxygenase-like cupin family protein